MPNSRPHAPEQSEQRKARENPTLHGSGLVAALIVAAVALAIWAFLKTRDVRGPSDDPSPRQRIIPGALRPENAP